MQWLGSKGVWLWTILLVSLAFNVGFGGTYGKKVYDDRCRAQRHDDGGGNNNSNGNGNAGRRKNPYEALDLTPQQQEQLKALREQMLAQSREAWQSLHTERAALAELLVADAPEPAAITARIDALMAAQRLTQERLVEHLLAEKALLRPEQRAAFYEIIRHRLGPREGKWRHGPDAARNGREAPAPDSPAPVKP